MRPPSPLFTISSNLSESQALAIPSGATLTGVRLTDFLGAAASGSLTMTASSTELAPGSAITTAQASLVIAAGAATFTTTTLPLSTPLLVTNTMRVHAQATGPNTATFCGATPIYTMP